MLRIRGYLWLRNRHVKRFLANARRTQAVQRDVLLAKLATNAESEFGREHGFSGIKTVADFRRQVPITTFEYYRDYVERVKGGDLRAMFGPKVRLLMFALTSGTTGHSKYIPITQQFFNEYRTGWNYWAVRTFVDHPDLANKQTVQLSSDWQQSHTEGGIACGNISGLAAETAPRISNPIFILPRCLIKISDTASKQYAALRLSLPSSRVGMIVTANPSTLVQFARLADLHHEMLIRDVFDGTLADEVAVPAEIRHTLRRRLRPDRQRARELERIVSRTGRLFPRDFWPGLSVLAVWTGGSVGMYLPRLREYYGDTAFRDHGLSASEGRMTIPLRDGTSAGILDYVHQYFEFVPEAEHGRPNPNVLEAHELAEGQSYYIILTTSSGLYRYDIHDVVRCVGFEGTAPILEFLNKGSLMSNITGEKLSEFQIVAAVKKAFAGLQLPTELFTVAPVFGDPPGYELLLEEGIVGDLAAELAQRVDAELAQLNCEYANRLETGRLHPLSIQQLPRGTWTAYREAKIAQFGGSLEQYKHPCLVSDVHFAELLRKLKPVVGFGESAFHSA